MHIEAASVQKINERFILVAVPLVAGARGQEHKVGMETLGNERIVGRTNNGLLFDSLQVCVQELPVVSPDDPWNLGQTLAPRIVERIGYAVDCSNKDSRFFVSRRRICHRRIPLAPAANMAQVLRSLARTT